MFSNVSNHGNNWRKLPQTSSSFAPNLPQKRRFDLTHQYIGNHMALSTDWRKLPGISHCRYLMKNQISRIHYEQEQQASEIANILENCLFIAATSQDEYMNQDTLLQRLETHLYELYATKCSQPVVPSSGFLPAWSNGSLLEPAFQKVVDPIINATDYCGVALDNNYGFPQGGLSHPALVPELVFSPDNGSSISTCTDMEIIPNFPFSGAGGNLEASPYFPQQQTDNLGMDLMEYRDGSGTISTPFLTTMETFPQSEFSNSLTSQHVSREISEASNLFPSLSSFGDERQYQYPNLKELHGKIFMAQPTSCLDNQGEDCCQTLGQKNLEQPQPFTGLLNRDEQLTSESSAVLFGLGGSANVNSSITSSVSVEQRILFAYFQHKNSLGLSRDSVIKHLHSTVCYKGICCCEQYSKLLLHFDDCQSVDCYICYSWRLCNTDILQQNLEFPNSIIVGSVVRENDAPSDHPEAMQPATKRQKMDSAFDAPSINNASSDQSTHRMVQPYFSEALSKLQQQPESPLSSIYSDVTECNVEQVTNPMFDSTSISEAKNNVIDNTFGQTLKSETTLSNGLEADHITEEPDLNNHDVEASNSLKETVIGSNSNTCCTEPRPADIEDTHDRTEFNQAGVNTIKKVIEPEAKEKETESSNPIVNTVPLTEVFTSNQIMEEPDLKNHDVKASSNLTEAVIGSNSNMDTLCKEPMPGGIEDIQDRIRFNQAGINAIKKVFEPKADQEKETESSNPTVNTVSLTDFFTSNQITEHIMSLRNQLVQSTTDEEPEIPAYSCQLCEKGPLYFAPDPIYCVCCDSRIKRNASYYCGKAEEIDAQHCFCSACYRGTRGGHITFNGKSFSKALLDKRKNVGALEESVSEEPWVECDKCKGWQHQICALYNSKRDLDFSAEYTCPICRLEEIENGMHIPLPKTAMLGAKDLPRTTLSDHIERRLFKRLMQESEDWVKDAENKNLDEVLVAENLSVRVVSSVDKQLEVKKQFLNIFVEENYPAEFFYTSKVILLFQQIEGVDVCLFAMYAQEFGSECGYPNQRCLYISYLDSVKYFRPERATISGEALRTFVYHEILIGYLDYCKKQGFTTCYIWACPPKKEEDYILYCHPNTQKTPKNDKLRHWYHSLLRKAAEERIVVGLTNIYDHFFVSDENNDAKVSASCLPYFDGDYWSGAAMDIARDIEQKSGGEYEKMLKKLVTKRTLKGMGHVNPSKQTAKDILVMQRLGQTILPVKEDFIIVHLQHSCMHCHEVIVSGKRWFCSECNKFQECERCHTSDSHTSISGEKHRLSQVFMDDIPSDTKENDIVLDSGLFDNRNNFLNFCQVNQLQFDTLRRAKYSSMMILFHLRNPTLLTAETICSICSKPTICQEKWKCEICPEFTVCSACYNERGAICHKHKMSQTCSKAQCPSENQKLKQTSVFIQELEDVVLHVFQCRLTTTKPCTYPHCLQIKKLFSHANKCTIRLSGGCQLCRKAWTALVAHSRNCRNSECRIPHCMNRKRPERIATLSEPQ